MKAIAAIYKEGVFKPLEKVGLEEDAKVVIRVERSIVDKSGIILAKEPKFFTDMLRGLVKRAEYDKSEYLEYIMERSE